MLQNNRKWYFVYVWAWVWASEYVCRFYISILPAFEKNRLIMAWENAAPAVGTEKKNLQHTSTPITHSITGYLYECVFVCEKFEQNSI